MQRKVSTKRWGMFFYSKVCYNRYVNIIHFFTPQGRDFVRKITKATGDVLLGGDSLVNGISIRYAERDHTGEFKYLPGRSAAKVDAGGEIYYVMDSKLVSNETDMLIERVTKVAKKLKITFSILVLVMALLAVASVFFEIGYGVRIGISLACLMYGLSGFSNNLAWFIMRLKKDEEAISLMKFHSAEHAVINAYYDLKRLPEYREMRFYSNYSHTCGTLQFASKLVIFTGFALVNLILSGYWLIIGHLIVLLVAYLLHKEDKLYFLESVVLIQPTSKEYKVAIAALGTELTRKQMLEEDLDLTSA